jgi:hypothetical protein
MRRMPGTDSFESSLEIPKAPAVTLEETRCEEEGDSNDDGNYPLYIHGQEGRWNAVRVCGILGSTVGHSSKGISSRDQVGPPSMKW